MSLLDMLYEKKQLEAQQALQQQQMSMFSKAYGEGPSDVTGSMTSSDMIGPAGSEQPVNTQTSVSPEYSSPGSGLLGNPNDPNAAAQFRMAGMNAGLQGGDVNQMVEDARRIGSFANRKDQMGVQRTFEQDFKKDVKPFRERAQYYDDTLALGDYKNWTGPDDFIAMRNLLKQSLPNESVMGDDLSNLTVSGGMPAMFSSLIQQLQGSGLQGITARKEMLYTMKKNAIQSNKYSDEIRNKYKEQASTIPGIDAKFMLKPIYAIPPQYRFFEKDGKLYKEEIK